MLRLSEPMISKTLASNATFLPVVAQDIAAIAAEEPTGRGSTLTVHTLGAENEAEVLAFLAERPIHTVFMSGFIHDNGLVSELNRGTFYGCRNWLGRLEGVALIGHFTLMETRSEAAIASFAQLGQACPSAHMILGEEDKIQSFWSHFAQAGRAPRRVCRELLFELQSPIEALEPVSGLRHATPADLRLILPVFAQLVFQETGADPLDLDPSGFSERCLRRIEQGRVWVWIQNERLIFSANVVSESPDVIYLEGIYVDPDERGKGCGLRCISQLSRDLLQRAGSLCVLVNEQNPQAQAFYEKAGYKLRDYYDTIFLHLKN